MRIRIEKVKDKMLWLARDEHGAVVGSVAKAGDDAYALTVAGKHAGSYQERTDALLALSLKTRGQFPKKEGAAA